MAEQIKNIQSDTQLKKDQSSAAVMQAANTNAVTNLIAEQTKGAAYDNVGKSLEADIYASDFGAIAKALGVGGNAASSAAGIARLGVQGGKAAASAVKNVSGKASAPMKFWKDSPALKMKPKN